MAQLNPNFEIDFSDINSYEQIQLINDAQLAKENLLMHRAYKEPSDDAIIRNQFSSFTFVDFCPKLFTLRPNSAASHVSSLLTNSSGGGSLQDKNQQAKSSSGSNSKTLGHYELETFSDLFDRINNWLKLNKDWRVVSMETLVFDCTSQFNHLKSSIHQNYSPKNTRGLRLFLSPSKSRFSGPQKIGCINVIPRKVSGSYLNPNKPIEYETLDQILSRLNELLLTRPIEGRILSVETITLPIINGYVNTETNYYMDDRLNLLYQNTYSPSPPSQTAGQAATPSSMTSGGGGNIINNNSDRIRNLNQLPPYARQMNNGSNTLIDILRVYYEFGPMVCGLVNLIDFVPRFYPSAVTTTTAATTTSNIDSNQQAASSDQQADGQQQQQQQSLLSPSLHNTSNHKIPTTESLTRLIRRSLTWFERERKRILADSSQLIHNGSSGSITSDQTKSASSLHQALTAGDSRKAINLKVCNLQVHHKIMLKSDLIQVEPSNVLERVKTRLMTVHYSDKQPIDCAQCSLSTRKHPPDEWCPHLVDLAQPYEVKFVRLAYVVPIHNKYSRSVCPMRPLKSSVNVAIGRQTSSSTTTSTSTSTSSSTSASDSSASASGASSPGQTRDSRPSSGHPPGVDIKSTPVAANSGSKLDNNNGSMAGDSRTGTMDNEENEVKGGEVDNSDEDGDNNDEDVDDADADDDDLRIVEQLLAQENAEEYTRQVALSIVSGTNERHRANELAHQLQQNDDSLNDAPIGQLTYRLFAPCQLVNSSSCFSINPVNSSNPLARRGSVDLNGGGLSSENAHPSSHLINMAQQQQNHDNNHHHHHQQQQAPGVQQQVISFGAFFPALSHDIIPAESKHHNSQGPTSATTASKFTTNEFEPVEAIRRRMEVYVTTNSMKVIAGETLVVNLSDVLSCLSTAIEQTVVRASFARRAAPSTWVSVYMLYAAVDEPQLPSQLLEQQRLRERLVQISEQEEEEEEEKEEGDEERKDEALDGPSGKWSADRDEQSGEQRSNNLGEQQPEFDDDFDEMIDSTTKPAQDTHDDDDTHGQATSSAKQQPPDTTGVHNKVVAGELHDPTIRIEKNPDDSSLMTIYNSAYDRTVALPTQPDNHLSHYLEPNEFLGSQSDCLWLDENDLFEAQLRIHDHGGQGHKLALSSSLGRRRSRKKSLKGSTRRNRHVDSGCSIM